MLSCPAICTSSVFPARSGAESTTLKLISLPPKSHIDTVPVSKGSCVATVTRVAVGEACSGWVGEADGVGDALADGCVGVGWGAMPQYCRSKSPLVAEREGSDANSKDRIVPSGQI